MNAWDDLAHDLDTGRIAHQLVLDCTQLSIPALREDPIGAINRYVGINLVYADQDGSGCGSGYYRPDPPTIYLHHAPWRRNAFTVLHELAHHLQRHHPEWGFHLMDIRDIKQRMRVEEMVCDHFAAEILLPTDQMTDDDLSRHPADVMAGLLLTTTLSRQAAMNAVKDRMPPYAKWILCVVDPQGAVTTSTATYEQYPPSKNHVHLALAALAEQAEDGPVRKSLRNAYTYSTGATLTRMWAEACRDHENRYTFIALRPEQRFGTGEIVDERFICRSPSCDVEFDSTRNLRKCNRCGAPQCPDCGTCSCEPVSTGAQCPHCWCELTPYETQHGHECM